MSGHTDTKEREKVGGAHKKREHEAREGHTYNEG